MAKVWYDNFDERQNKQIMFSRVYAADFAHGADGHNNMLIVAKMADLLDDMAKQVRQLETAAEYKRLEDMANDR
jgi:hypothetical protein